MTVCSADLSRVPAANVRVDLAQFTRVWVAAQTHQDSPAHCDAFTAGVLDTCRWLAGATLRPDAGAWFPAPAPITASRGSATPERIDAECKAADLLASLPVDAVATAERERVAGVCATLGWAWRRVAPCPLAI